MFLSQAFTVSTVRWADCSCSVVAEERTRASLNAVKTCALISSVVMVPVQCICNKAFIYARRR